MNDTSYYWEDIMKVFYFMHAKLLGYETLHAQTFGVICIIEDTIVQSRLRWYGHVMRGDISSQAREVMEIEINGKRKKR